MKEFFSPIVEFCYNIHVDYYKLIWTNIDNLFLMFGIGVAIATISIICYLSEIKKQMSENNDDNPGFLGMLFVGVCLFYNIVTTFNGFAHFEKVGPVAGFFAWFTFILVCLSILIFTSYIGRAVKKRGLLGGIKILIFIVGIMLAIPFMATGVVTIFLCCAVISSIFTMGQWEYWGTVKDKFDRLWDVFVR